MSAYREARAAIDGTGIETALLVVGVLCIVVGLILVCSIAGVYLHDRFERRQRRRWLLDAGVPAEGIEAALRLDERYAGLGKLFARFVGPRLPGWDRWSLDDDLRTHRLSTIRSAYYECLAEERRHKDAIREIYKDV